MRLGVTESAYFIIGTDWVAHVKPIVVGNSKRVRETGKMPGWQLGENTANRNCAMWLDGYLLGRTKHGATTERPRKRVMTSRGVVDPDSSGEVHHVHYVALCIVLEATGKSAD
jgi:hypothetical protein